MVNTATVARDVQVGRGWFFEPHRWREAILAYLNGIWSGNRDVADWPQLMLKTDPEAEDSDPSLCLRLLGNEYCAYGTAATSRDPSTGLYSHEMIFVGSSQYDVESALIRFVRNDAIRAIRIDSAHGGCVWLWKTNRRSELCVTASGIAAEPAEWETPWGIRPFPSGR